MLQLVPLLITLSLSVQTGMLDFSGTAQKGQMVQHYDHYFLQTVISNRWHYELFITKVHGLLLSCYYLASIFVLSLDSNISGLHVNLLPGWTSIGGAGHESMIGCSLSVVSISPLPSLQTWISLV